jgi:hypothetical protein
MISSADAGPSPVYREVMNNGCRNEVKMIITGCQRIGRGSKVVTASGE